MVLHVDNLGSGPDLVLLHGWGMHSAMWGRFPALLAKDHRLHLIDLPGHGLSTPSDCCTLGRLTELVMERMPRRDVSLLGWSLGALVALQLASSWPERVRTLVLVSATPCFVQRQDWPCALAPAVIGGYLDRIRRDPAEATQRFLSLVALGSPEPKTQAAQLRRMLGERPHVSAETLEAAMRILQETDLRPMIGGVRGSACVIQGAADAIVPAPAGRWLAQSLSAAAFHLLEGGHAPFLSHGERIASLVRAVTHG